MKPTVWIVYNDRRKDMSKAEQYGELRDVFSSVGRDYNGQKLIEHARSVLSKAKEDDYLLIVGDPTLCAICFAAMLEQTGIVKVLRWDRDNFQYHPLSLDFSWEN